MSSPGLFNPNNLRSGLIFPAHPSSDTSTPAPPTNSPYLHPLQNHKVRETHKALVDLDLMTGRKIINQYEVIEEIGRGVHGKVKLARNLETGENVAIKIVARFSKKRRLGKVTALSPQDKTKKEIAILKKIRHPNVVALHEIIDDPELKKIYMVLEHVELGEIVWRKKGLPLICAWERKRVEREMNGDQGTDEEKKYIELLERRHHLNELKRARMQQKSQKDPGDYWSIEYGAASEGDPASLPRVFSRDGEAGFYGESYHGSSRAGSRTTSRAATPIPSEADLSSVGADYSSDIETPGPLCSQPGSSTALDGTMYGPYVDENMFRDRSPSMADSIISHMSSVDFNPQPHDPFADDYSYVPCFTLDDARATFRDTVLGLEYLHYEGIVHRDIKPANLLWTRDHRVKISDFGVSYFGRPIREGEVDDFVSESEARDFDDDLELAKTVGTPAFFAPELCYTDIDDGEPPKVSEQIDVWSLGVTLYCLVFARIPFMAEDEFQMFRKIAKEDVHIPRRRLKPVDPQTSPAATSLYHRINHAPYRDDGEIAYEDIDENLHDLLSRMLVKNPEKRIRLRDVKRHEWVVQGIDNLVGWLDDTDPSRKTAGRKIQVDQTEMSHAVVPLTFLERARSMVKKTIGKVMPHRSDGLTRRRAASSAASSTADSVVTASTTPHIRDARRKSLRGDDYFSNAKEAPVHHEHPLSQSVTASPQGSPAADSDGRDPSKSTWVGGDQPGQANGSGHDFNASSDITDSSASRMSASLGQTPSQHLRARSMNNNFLVLTPYLRDSHTMPTTPAADMSIHENPIAALKKARDVDSLDDSSRSRSVDRGLFASLDKRASPQVSLTTAVAPGNMEFPKRRLREPHMREDGVPVSPPAFFSPQAIRAYHNGSPRSDTSFVGMSFSPGDPEDRFLTAQKVLMMEGKTPPPRTYNSSTPESFARAQEHNLRRQHREHDEDLKRKQLFTSRLGVNPAYIPCPPSPDDHVMAKPPPPCRCDTTGTVVSTSSTSLDNMATPLTSPSEVTSPVSMTNLPAHKEGSQVFRSDPSLPALLSGASSVSADPEGEFLQRPGSVNRASLIDTADSLTPPAMAKEPLSGFPLETLEDEHALHLHLQRPLRSYAPSSVFSSRTVEDDDSDSDGILEIKPKRKAPVRDQPRSGPQPPSRDSSVMKRRDTQTSVGSTETAKKVILQHEYHD